MEKFDFSGWVTRANVKCSDGRTIMKDAFKHMDGKSVPLVWNHQHNSPENVLGSVMLEHRDDGVYGYAKFNDSPSGKTAKLLVQHGDVNALSIHANRLKEHMLNVSHGMIREVSLVLAGANPGAYIESVMSHGEDSGEEAIIFSGETITLNHSEDDEDPKEDNTDDHKEDDAVSHSDDKGGKEGDSKMNNEKTVKDVFDEMTEEQKTVVYAMIGQALEDAEVEHSEGGYDEMKHNVFDQDNYVEDNFLSHGDQMDIISLAKANNVGTFQNALEIYAEDNGLSHDAIASGFAQAGEGNVTELFPEYKDVRPGAPELITNDQGWVDVVMKKVHKSPISRIRTSHVDIRNLDSLRAKGYVKGKDKKLTGNIKLARRTTDPQTVYVKSALHRDDIIDITDFDYVQYLYNIDKMQLNEELAMAIMLGDGREDGDADKIMPEHIRPIWTDDELYTMHVDLDVAKAKAELQGTNTGASFGENYIMAEAMINTVLYAREKFKGSGTPDYFCTPRMLNVMLLARDMNGRRIYSSKSELASALNVGNIYTVEQFAGKTRTDKEGNEKKLAGIICNLADYSLGATKGGQVTHFTQFDIDFNQQKSLLETRVSGALTRLFSAIAIEEPVNAVVEG
jgi:HK97 family phage prohead protease